METLHQIQVQANDLLGYLRGSKAALRAFAMPYDETIEPTAFAEIAYQSPAAMAKAGVAPVPDKGRAQISIWHENPPGGEPCLWERIVCPDVSRAETLELVNEIDADEADPQFEVTDDEAEWVDIKPLPAKPFLWQYNPERLRKLMPYGEALSKLGLRHKGQPTTELLSDIMMAFAQMDARMLEAFPKRRRATKNRETARALRRYQESLLGFATYCGSGRQIFDIPQQMSDLFAKTDVDDVQWSNIKYPYPCFYLHFGAQANLDLGDGWLAEGAYIQEMGDVSNRHVNIMVVSAPPSMEAYLSVDTTAPPTYGMALGPQHMTMPLAEAVDLLLAEWMAQLRLEGETEPLREDVERVAREQGLPPGVKVVSVQRKRAREELAAMSSRHEAFSGMLRLIVNALCYLTAYPKDIETRWPQQTPPSLLRELEKAGENRNERQRVLTKMAAQGFSPVHLCGRKLAAELEAQALKSSGGGERTKATHWARGHWKRQHYGPQNSLRKLQWRMPILHRSRHPLDGDQDEPVGHVYLMAP